MKLGIKLALLSTALVGTVVAATSWVFAQSLRRAAEREVDAELRSDARLVQYAQRSGQQAEDVLLELARPGLSWLVIRDGQPSRAKLSKELERDQATVTTHCQAIKRSAISEQQIAGIRYRSVAIELGSGSQGCLLRSLDGVIERAKTVQTTLFAVGRGAILLALLISGLWGLLLMGRVRRLLTAMQQVAGGHFDVDLPHGGNDELTAVAHGLEQMIRKLRGTQDELQSTAAHEREAALAARLRSQLLPLHPSMSGFEFSARIIPAPGGGGDFYETYQGEQVGFVAVGNISGSGVQPGLTMVIVDSLLQASLRLNQKKDASPAAVLRQVAASLYECLRKRMQDEQMVSVLLLRHDGGGKVTFSGHLPLLLLYRDGNRTVETVQVDRAGLAVSTQLDEALSDRSVQLAPGDSLILLTDGITDARNIQNQRLSHDVLIDEIRKTARTSTAAELRDHLLDVVHGFVGSPTRDLTVVVLRRDPATSKSQQGSK